MMFFYLLTIIYNAWLMLIHKWINILNLLVKVGGLVQITFENFFL